MGAAKEINVGRLLGCLPDLSVVTATAIDGPFVGAPCSISWECRWVARVSDSFVRLSDVLHLDLHLDSPIGSFTLERALATHNDFAGTVSGVCIATKLDAGALAQGERATYRTFIRATDDLLGAIAFPGWIRDENGVSSRAWLPLHVPNRFELDVYYIKEGPYFVIESSQEGLTLDKFRSLSGGTRQLLSYLLAIRGDADSCEVVTPYDADACRRAHWYAGRTRTHHFYKPIPTTWPEINDGARTLGLNPAQTSLQPDVISGCLAKLLDQPGLVTPIEYLLRFGDAPVEMRGAFLSVALESLTDQMEKQGLLASVKPLNDEVWKPLRKKLHDEVKGVSAGWTATQQKVIASRIDNLNSPTNADKLNRPFNVLSVPVSDDEREAIVRRNTFLHEGRLLDPEVVAGDPDAWKEAYAVEMRIYTAVNKLLLRYLGYEGAVIDWGNTQRETGRFAYVRSERPPPERPSTGAA